MKIHQHQRNRSKKEVKTRGSVVVSYLPYLLFHTEVQKETKQKLQHDIHKKFFFNQNKNQHESKKFFST
jgi:hypothetical protein